MADKRQWTRRSVLGGIAGTAGVGAAALGKDGQGNLAGGTMLQDSFRVKGTDIWIGPDTQKGNVTPKKARLYYATDTQLDYYADGSSWVQMGIGSQSNPVQSIHSESVSTESASITEHGEHADLIVRRLDTDTLLIVDGETNEPLQQGNWKSAGSLLQPFVDNYQGEQLHLHFGTGNYRFDQKLIIQANSLLVTGAGRNNTMIAPDADLPAGSAVWEIDGGDGSGFIYQFENFKMVGRRSSGITATGIHIISGAEYIFDSVEIRSFAQKNLFIDTNSGGWSGLYDFWSLDPGDIGTHIKGSDSTLDQREWDIVGSKFKNENGGNHALSIDNAKEINITGGHITGTDPLIFGRVSGVTVDGTQFWGIDGNYAIGLGLPDVDGSLCARVKIADCQAEPATQGNCTFVQLNPGSDRVQITNNRAEFFNQVVGPRTSGRLDNTSKLVLRDNTPPANVDIRDLWATRGNYGLHTDTGGGGTQGHYEYDGTSWIGYGAASGSSI